VALSGFLFTVSAEVVEVKRKAAREVGALQEQLRAAQKVATAHSPEAWQQQAAALAACQVSRYWSEANKTFFFQIGRGHFLPRLCRLPALRLARRQDRNSVLMCLSPLLRFLLSPVLNEVAAKVAFLVLSLPRLGWWPLSSCLLAVPPAWILTSSPLPVQHDLKGARAEAARKGRLLAAAEGEAKQRAAAVAVEAEARAALEAELGRARLGAARQAAVVKELHRKLEAAQGVDRDASAELQRAQAAEEKVRTLTAALARKDGALKELRAQAHAEGRDAGAAAAAVQEKEGLEAAVRKWQGEAARRWATPNTGLQPSLLKTDDAYNRMRKAGCGMAHTSQALWRSWMSLSLCFHLCRWGVVTCMPCQLRLQDVLTPPALLAGRLRCGRVGRSWRRCGRR
jgi:hypothetical protein